MPNSIVPFIFFPAFESHYPPGEARLLIPMGYQRINSVRRERFESACARGYDFVSYVSTRASHWPDLKIGRNVLIYEHAIIQPFVSIGDNCIIRSGAHISHHCTVESHCFIAAEVVMGGQNRNRGAGLPWRRRRDRRFDPHSPANLRRRRRGGHQAHGRAGRVHRKPGPTTAQIRPGTLTSPRHAQPGETEH